MLMFVYGTLKQGFRLNEILATNGATFQGWAVVEGHDLLQVGNAYPVAYQALSFNSQSMRGVLGEVWEVPDSTYRTIDAIERAAGYDSRLVICSLYRSREAALDYFNVAGRTNSRSPAYMYVFKSRIDHTTIFRPDNMRSGYTRESWWGPAPANPANFKEINIAEWRVERDEGQVHVHYTCNDADVLRHLSPDEMHDDMDEPDERDYYDEDDE